MDSIIEKNENQQEADLTKSKKINNSFMSNYCVDTINRFVERIKTIGNGLNNKPPETENIKIIQDSDNMRSNNNHNIFLCSKRSNRLDN